MKKSKMAAKLLKLLKTYEDCQMNKKAAIEVINLLVEEGMWPPYPETPRNGIVGQREYYWDEE